MGGLVELLGIKGAADAKGDTRAKEDVVGDGRNTTVVDLGLDFMGQQIDLNPCTENTHLGE